MGVYESLGSLRDGEGEGVGVGAREMVMVVVVVVVVVGGEGGTFLRLVCRAALAAGDAEASPRAGAAAAPRFRGGGRSPTPEAVAAGDAAAGDAAARNAAVAARPVVLPFELLVCGSELPSATYRVELQLREGHHGMDWGSPRVVADRF